MFQGTYAADINNAGDVVGYYTSGGVIRGFHYADGQGFDDIGSLAGGLTRAGGISASGVIVGSSWVPGSPATNDVRRWGHAVMLRDPVIGLEDLNDLIDPMLGWTLSAAIEVSGDYIVGTGDLNGALRAFRLRISTGDVEDITGGWVGATFGQGVNQFGDTVGWGFLDAANTQRASFVYSDRFGFKKLADMIAPGSSLVPDQAVAINDSGEVLGVSFAGGQTRSFTVSLAPQAVACGQPVNQCGGSGPGAVCLWSDGVVDIGAGRYVAVFGYQSTAAGSISPTTNEVRINGAIVQNPLPAPPASLQPGGHPGAYLPRFEAGQTVSWTVNDQIVIASAGSLPVLPRVPIGANGYGVILNGQLVVLVPDTGPPAEPTAQQEPPVGAPFAGVLSGTLTTSPSGAAVYTVPITLPPGIAGMVPNLNLVYNSQGGNGIAGQGWDLTGLSIIHRCPKTRVQDGAARPIAMNNLTPQPFVESDADGVCLDGKRLFRRNDNIFEAEAHDFSVITKSADDQTFTVVTKTGETRYYGSRADARVVLAGSSSQQVAIWALDKVVDVWGNYYEVHYNNFAVFPENGFIVTRIDYTGHLPGPDSSAIPPFHSITFNYETQIRPDVRRIRFNKGTLPRTRRLSNIVTPLGTYTLTYLPDSDPMLPSRLGQIAYCSGSVCLDPLVFAESDWEGGGYAWTPAPSYALPAGLDRGRSDNQLTTRGTQFVDLDGDGRADFVRARGGNRQAWRNTGTGWQLRTDWALPADLAGGDGKRANTLLADVNEDGLVDIVFSAPICPPSFNCFDGPLNVWINAIKTGGGWQRRSDLEVLPSGWGTVHFTTTDRLADMNGDGRLDLVRYGPGQSQLQVLHNLTSGWTTSDRDYTYVWAPINIPVVDFTLDDAFHLEDINRDGLADLVSNHRDQQEPDVVVVPNTGSATNVWGPTYRQADPVGTSPPGSRIIGDVDGDGLHDVTTFQIAVDITSVTPFAASTSLKTALKLGTGVGYTDIGAQNYVSALNTFGPPPATGLGPSQLNAELMKYVFAMADLNADGLADMVLKQPDGGQVLVNSGTTWRDLNGATSRQTSAGANAVHFVPSEHEELDGEGAAFIDLDGDGVTDLVRATETSGSLVSQAWLNEFKPPVIRKFPNGLARKSEVTYRVITTAEAQTAGTYLDTAPLEAGTTYLALPLRVAAAISVDDGLGTSAMSTTTYAYGSMRGSSHGRGPQGFRTTTMSSPLSGTTAMTTVTTYAQAYPYTGLPVEVRRYTTLFQPPAPTAEVTFTETTTTYCDAIAPAGATPQCAPPTGYDEDHYPVRTSLFVYPVHVTDKSYVHSGVVAAGHITVTSEFRYDESGNPIRTTVATQSSDGESYRKETLSSYGAVGSPERRLGKVREAVVTSQRIAPPDGNNLPITHTTGFDYGTPNQFVTDDGITHSTLALSKKRVEPGAQAPLELHTAFGYDRFGNVTLTTVCATDFGACDEGAPGPAALPFRTTQVSYDTADFNFPAGPGLVEALGYTDGRFPVRTINAAGHTEYSAYDPLKGAILQKTGPNGVHTCYAYDAFGTQTSETARCGSGSALSTSINRYRTTPLDPALTKVVTVTRPPAGGATWGYSDALGRPILSRERHFNGSFTETTASYDPFGRKVAESKPRRVGDPSYQTGYTFDALGRLERVTRQLAQIDGTSSNAEDVTVTTYMGFTIETRRTIAGDEQIRRERKNAIGKVASVITSDEEHPNYATISYKYDAEGAVTDVIDPAGHVVHTVYVNGRKTEMTDPDLGTWTYGYNGFGDLVSQIDAKAQTTTMSYDQLGRMTSRTELAGTPQATTAAWVYDSAPGAGVGKLALTVSGEDSRFTGSCANPLSGGNRAVRSFKYTPFGDLEEDNQCIDGNTFTTNYEYDAFARPRLVRYPAIGGDRLGLEHHYTQLGYLHYVTEAANGSVYWAALEMNALGQVTRERVRNGVETVVTRSPSTGWLLSSESISRADADRTIQKWDHRYDEAGNLRFRRRSDLVNAAPSEETFTYDFLNRLTTSRVVVETQPAYDLTEAYMYDTLGNITSKAGSIRDYDTGCMAGSRSAGPHAVCAVAGGAPFTYDGNGNMLAGGSRTVDYNAANKPIHMTSSAPLPSAEVQLLYGADSQRVVQSTVSSGETSRTLYVGLGATGRSLYERTTAGGAVTHVQFLYAGAAQGGAPFAVRTLTGTSAAGADHKYYHYDHLGSVTAMSDAEGRVLGGSGADATAFGYDPWGSRRDPSGNAANAASFNQQAGRREFTGHETISKIGLVNMNGRVYDPSLGRFLSPDPTVQFVAESQNYNRYSYALNNPLRYTDPTGYSVLSDISTESIFLTGMSVGFCAVGGPAGCAVAGLMVTAYSTGSMVMAGASLDQVLTAASIGVGAGMLGGLAGGAIAGEISSKLGAAVVGGAVGGAVSTTLTTVFLDGDLGWDNILSGAALGAASGAVAWYAKRTAPVAEANVAKASGAAELEGILIACSGDECRVLPSGNASAIRVVGDFQDKPDTRAPGPGPGGKDAITRFRVDWDPGKSTVQRSADGTEAKLNIAVKPRTLQTTYYGSAQPGHTHALHGTLGNHEVLHKSDFRAFFTTDNLRAIIAREGIILEFSFPKGTSAADVRLILNAQIRDISNYLTSYSTFVSNSHLHGGNELMPVFWGQRR